MVFKLSQEFPNASLDITDRLSHTKVEGQETCDLNFALPSSLVLRRASSPLCGQCQPAAIS